MTFSFMFIKCFEHIHLLLFSLVLLLLLLVETFLCVTLPTSYKRVRLEEDSYAISIVIIDVDEISVLRTKSKKHC